MARDVTLLIKLRDQVSGKVRAIEGASKKAEIQVKKLQRLLEELESSLNGYVAKASAL